MHILIFEPRYKGHHLLYVQMLIPALLEAGCRVTLAASPEVYRSAEYAGRLECFARDVEELKGLPPLEGGGEATRRMVAQLRAAVGTSRPDRVWAPTADGLVQRLGIMALRGGCGFLREIALDANLLRCRFAYPSARVLDRAKLAMVRQTIAAAPVSRLLTIDAVACERLRAAGGRLGRRIEMIPDPLEGVSIPPRDEAKQRLGLPVNGRFLVLAGVLDDRKGVGRLLEAFAAAKVDPLDRVLIAGKPQPAVLSILSSALAVRLKGEGRLLTIERTLNDRDMADVTAASHIVCAPYIDHVGPSAMVSRAVAMGRPVLGTAYGWMQVMIPRLNAGWVCDTADVADFARVLEAALAQPGADGELPVSERLRAFSSATNFANVWMRSVREQLGMAAQPEISWASVIAAAAPEGGRS
jgi:glycosyltransferase involved in cell wall biosynthesis